MVLQPAPLHPVIIEDVPPIASGPEPPAPVVAVTDDTAQLAAMNSLAAGERDH
jgi:hypothetical protein